MRAEEPSQESVREEAVTVSETWFPLSQTGRDALKTVVAVVVAFGVFWWIVFSLLSGLENRLIDRMDLNHRELSSQLEGLERRQGILLAGQGTLRELSSQFHGLERSMAEGFKQSHQRLDRIDGRLDRIDGRLDRIQGHMDGRMDRIESDIDQMKSDIDAIEEHLIRIGSAPESKGLRP